MYLHENKLTFYSLINLKRRGDIGMLTNHYWWQMQYNTILLHHKLIIHTFFSKICNLTNAEKKEIIKVIYSSSFSIIIRLVVKKQLSQYNLFILIFIILNWNYF